MLSTSNEAGATDDYETLYQGFHWHVPPDFSIAQLCAGRWAGDAGRIAILYEDDAGHASTTTYAELWHDARRLAQALRRHGVARGDRVAIVLPQRPETAVAHIACHLLGAVAMPLSILFGPEALAYRLQDSAAVLAIIDQAAAAALAEIRADCPALKRVLGAGCDSELDWDAELAQSDGDIAAVATAASDPAILIYTSGTTGAPKGALGSHRNMTSNILSAGYAAARTYLRRGETPPDPVPRTMLTVIPMFHCTACSAGMMGAVATGTTTIFMRRWDAVRAMEIIERERVQMTGGVPTIAWQLLEHPDRAKYDLSSLDTIAYGGAPSAPELVKRIHEEFGALPGNGWGMTETMATVTTHGGEDYLNRPTSAGPPVATADLEIRADDGVTVLPTGEVGELWARGPMIVKGYWNKPEATAATFVDGWVRTGDLARLDDEGFLYVVDRAKDMVIRGGENIYSTEVENVLYAHPAVTDCALIGVPHRSLGEEPAAVVHLAPGMSATEEELKVWVRERLAAFKTPVAIRFVADTLPRNANGKILKKDLKILFEEPAQTSDAR